MNLIDMHCDTLWYLMDLGGQGDLKKNDGSVSIEYMKKAGTKAQFFACFTYILDEIEKGMQCDMTEPYDRCYQKVLKMIDYLDTQIAENPTEIAFAHSYDEMQENAVSDKISAFLTVEEGGVLNGNLGRLDELYQRGVRLLTPMWNYENCIGYPNSKDPSVMEKGLKPFGVQTVYRMAEFGMLIDVSHASDGTFWDILHCADEAGGVVVASHSNCRSLCDHPRNLSDEMMRALAGQGGVAGLNFYGPFLDASNSYESRLDAMTRHVLHMIDVGGSEFPAVGTDFDGFDGMHEMDIPDVSCMDRLWDALKNAKVTEEQLDKIFYKKCRACVKKIMINNIKISFFLGGHVL